MLETSAVSPSPAVYTPHRMLRLLAITLVTAAMLACSAHPAPITPVATSLPAPDPRTLAETVRTLARETAAIRGLAFTRDVPVSVQSPEQITAHIRDELTDEHDEIETERQIGIAMGVLPPDIDLTDALARFIGTEAQGYYDPHTASLVLSAHDASLVATPGPAGLDARATVVHELVHALQHQHFRARIDDDDTRSPSLSDTARARLALLEGDATLVAMEWTQHRRGGRILGAPDMEQRLARWAENAQVLTEADVPPYLVESAEMPYEAGVIAVGALYRAGGFARIDALIARDDVSTAEVMHSERGAFASVAVADDAVAPADARFTTVAQRTLGEMELRLQLGRVMRAERAASLAATWRGDRIVVRSRDRQLSMRWMLACEDEAHARQLAEAFAPLVARWTRDGCPGLLGGAPGRCVANVTASGVFVSVVRGGE